MPETKEGRRVGGRRGGQGKGPIESFDLEAGEGTGGNQNIAKNGLVTEGTRPERLTIGQLGHPSERSQQMGAGPRELV